MRGKLLLSPFFLLLVLAGGNVSAYFNATYLSTTVFLTNSTTVHVVEGVQLYISNSSIRLYNQDRQALNQSLSSWQTVIGSPFLAQHIINPKASISNFTFLPGPITPGGNNTGYASLTMSYDARNSTSVVSIAPRQFQYSFNASVFNFLHTASGQALLPNTRLTFVVPNGTTLTKVYPLPDSPQPNSFGKYTGTNFNWFSGEPLTGFSFVYVVQQTPQQEVVQYFNGIYSRYTSLVYLLVILAIAAVAIYLYSKLFR